jgi:SAM-dependent methyltransferase
VDFHEIAERDHELQNPTSAEKIRLLGSYLRLGPESRVLDVACGKCGPALLLASTFGCRVVGVELRAAFADVARERVAAAGLQSLVEVHTADAREFLLEPGSWNAALCLGASFVWGTIADAAASLVPAVKRGGFVAIGEPYWRGGPLPADVDDEGWVDFAATVDRFVSAGLSLTGLIAADQDDWDRYRSLQWRALEEWLPAHPGSAGIRTAHERARAGYLVTERELLGWAIFVGLRPG